MLHWTAAGAVASPLVVQIRVTRAFPGRVVAGAPNPTRSLTDAEITANLRHFTIDRRGPRARACTGVVLSGVDAARRPEIGAILADARGWGVTRITLHLGKGDRDALVGSAVGRAIDAVAVTVTEDRDVADVAALARVGGYGGSAMSVSAVVPLDEATLPRLDHLADGLAAVRAARVVLTWPLPDGSTAPPPHADRVAAALIGSVNALEAAGVEVIVKGLPACRLASLASRVSRTGNRWYVDADHQGEGALLFFPDVVRFARVDECRFCAAADRCDGVPEAWARARIVGPLRAIDPIG